MILFSDIINTLGWYHGYKERSLYNEYILNRNLKPKTIRSYTRKLKIYCQVTGLTPTQLIEQAEDNG